MSRKAKRDDEATAHETPADAGSAAAAEQAALETDAGGAAAAEAAQPDGAVGDAAPAGNAVPGDDTTVENGGAARNDSAGPEGGEDAAIDHVHEPAAYEAFPEIIAVEFDNDGGWFVVKLADGHHFAVRYADVDFLDDLDVAADWVQDIDIEPHRVAWPKLDRGLTVDRLLALAFTGKMPDDLLQLAGHERAMQDEAPAEPVTAAPRNRMDINVLAAYSAASLAFGTTEEDTTTLPRFDVRWLVQERGDRAQAAALCAAAFLRRDAAALVQPETLAIHLRRSGFADMPAATGRAAVAWKVFAFALAELDALDRAEADARRRAEQAAEAGQGPRPVRRLGLALQRRDVNPLTELGRRLQRDA